MQIEIEARPSYGMAVVTLDQGEVILAESGAMVAMSSGLAVDTTFNGAGGGGLVDFLKAMLAGLARKFLAGESMFVNKFRASKPAQQVMLSPAMVGDVEHLQLDGSRTVTVQAESYLASAPGVAVSLVWGGFSMLFSGEGAFFLKCTGVGDLLVNSYGAIEKVEVDGGYVVDTGHVVAWEGDLKYSIRKAGGWKSAMLSGEGLVLEFKGTGTLWLQTRNLGSFVTWLSPFFGD
ncbi:MAG: hypothetical protein ACI8PZ_003868 [Myxococcota bacterium]|jgi:uncharacterized protein (TIGR00266 family)